MLWIINRQNIFFFVAKLQFIAGNFKHMNKITKLLAASLCVFFLQKAQAQTEVTYGPEVGFMAAGLYDNEETIYAGVNLHIGGTAHIQLGNYFAVRPSLLFRPGMYMSDVDFTDQKIGLTRLSVPIPLLFSRNFDNGNKFFVGGGPNFMYSFSGKAKYEGQEEDIEFSGDNQGLKRFDLGMQLKGGFQFGMGLSLNLFFNGGFTNLAPDNDFDYKIQSMDAIGFSIGWMFGGGNNDY